MGRRVGERRLLLSKSSPWSKCFESAVARGVVYDLSSSFPTDTGHRHVIIKYRRSLFLLLAISDREWDKNMMNEETQRSTGTFGTSSVGLGV